ncbi:IS110 family transposase [Elizabethkingia anophelis]|uniref:Transposase IS116/IS110/IS902 family n=1 Tax=Elizabethkingia anophelis TaxID=1117645 RepID=A0A7Z7LY57_9FLAO|nr:IS110 family transposase [Elizabethkingia anophelis]MCT3628568.1 IS110 family transposase [Elizabethkingia anophelis]MCT3632494.1 IS110 family transposase [Elizabethkingia anophelis]MCT3690810.1 IS110 family transposase [Elizabethkingia anophelis]MCT3720317.1 IS110 family transposase [Elizabethkingia anophelis]MCT3723827.1 IS110 family transposase [Elizabethkingia anophelis]
MSNLEKKVIGVDVSSTILVMSFLDDENHSTIITINNSTTCIEKSLKRWDKHQFKIVVEATGSYSSKILYYAYSMGFEVYQVSGLSIKKFSEVKHHISKTDEQDAVLIRNFGEVMKMDPYEPKKENIEFLEQELNLWQDLEQEKARYTLKLKSLCQKPILNKSVIKHYETIIKRINKDIENLQKRLPSLEDKEFKENKDLLTSINGIGKKTALLLLASTNNFKNFKHSKALCKYFGVVPKMYHSGNKKISIGKCRTSKGFIRSILYVCSWSAIRFKKQCKALYERILEKKKCKKVALIAVCNKLLRQAFGIINSKIQYQHNY